MILESKVMRSPPIGRSGHAPSTVHLGVAIGILVHFLPDSAEGNRTSISSVSPSNLQRLIPGSGVGCVPHKFHGGVTRCPCV